MPANRFVVVEFPSQDTPLAGFTLRHPGATVDLILEPAVVEDGAKVHHSVVLIKGSGGPELSAFLKQLAKAYDHIEPIERDDVRGVWVGRVRVREAAYDRAPGTRTLVQFEHRFGAQWVHLEGGLTYIRARVSDTADGELLADQMRRYFQRDGVEAQVEVREISTKDYGVWEDLVQRSIGLSP